MAGQSQSGLATGTTTPIRCHWHACQSLRERPDLHAKLAPVSKAAPFSARRGVVALTGMEAPSRGPTICAFKIIHQRCEVIGLLVFARLACQYNVTGC
jgi:hypothetical protein